MGTRSELRACVPALGGVMRLDVGQVSNHVATSGMVQLPSARGHIYIYRERERKVFNTKSWL